MSRYPGSYPRESARDDRRDQSEDVPHSRLFILCGRGAREEQFREAFEKYGDVKDVWIVKDRRTNEDKGIAYVTFRKASEAALALEEMNGRCMDGHPRHLKVMIASERTYGSGKEPKEEEKMLRLFVVVPRDYEDKDLREEFEKYGDIDYANILKDRGTGQNKGFGYVKFKRPYHACLALENCDRIFKPKFAEPRMTPQEREELNYRRDSDRALRERMDDMKSRSFMDRDPYPSSRGPAPLMRAPPETRMRSESGYSSSEGSSSHLSVLTSNTLSEDQLSQLFDLIPDFEYCELDRMSGVAHVKYSNSQAAAYAKSKLEGFEYPLGYRLGVKYAHMPLSRDEGMRRGGGMNDREYETHRKLQSLLQDPAGGNLQTLVDTIQKAATIIQSSGLGSGGQTPAQPGPPNYSCSATLPPKEPLASIDAPPAQRLFLVFHSSSIPSSMLIDIFCRFGNLIDVYMITGKNFGYAKYATKESAEKAMRALHLQEINGYRIKVIEADPPKNEDLGRKRQRTDDYLE